MALNHNFFGPRWGAVRGTVTDHGLHLNLPLDIGGLVFSRPRQYARITETGLEQVRHDKYEQNRRDDRHSGCNIDRQVGAVKCEEESACQNDDKDAEVE